jgi:hypothetical protein
MAARTLGSGLIQEKVDLPAHQGDDAILLIQDLNGPEGQGAPQFPEGLVVQADLQEVGGKDAAQGWSLRKIAGALHEQEIPSKKGGRWHPGTIKYLVENTLYETGRI